MEFIDSHLYTDIMAKLLTRTPLTYEEAGELFAAYTDLYARVFEPEA